ncbi:hypothetical protein [Streptomyces sp. NRRL F-4474]|uniref:hypothetical protein n=1 Tax=Streptomyces sp. NRRL F-4474 TaxID=1463851 RepID=UPI0004CBFC7A|nr:hypothetical protein [Streptomyces sp. NRRL F-4474]
MITTEFKTSSTDVTTCEACWQEPVEAARTMEHRHGRDLLCIPCAEAGYRARVALFPPLGIYGLNGRKLKMGKHGSPSGPQLPPDPGPPLPSPPPTPTPGRPPV